jgi:hypothetical protein
LNDSIVSPYGTPCEKIEILNLGFSACPVSDVTLRATLSHEKPGGAVDSIETCEEHVVEHKKLACEIAFFAPWGIA